MVSMNNRSEQLNKFLERYYGYILVGVLGLVLVLMLNFFIWPQYQTMQSAGILQYRNSTDTVAQRRSYLQQLQQMEIEYKELDQRVFRAIDIALPTEYSKGPAFAEIEHLLDGTSFKVENVNIVADPVIIAADTTTAVSNVYEPVTVSLNISASGEAVNYEEFKTLLRRVEQNPHLMNLESMIYTPDTSAYTFVLKTYQRKQGL